MYSAYEIEEYILSGGFIELFNENLLKVNSDGEILRVVRDVVFWINLINVWLFIPLFLDWVFTMLRLLHRFHISFFFRRLAIWVWESRGKKFESANSNILSFACSVCNDDDSFIKE